MFCAWILVWPKAVSATTAHTAIPSNKSLLRPGEYQKVFTIIRNCGASSSSRAAVAAASPWGGDGFFVCSSMCTWFHFPASHHSMMVQKPEPARRKPNSRPDHATNILKGQCDGNVSMCFSENHAGAFFWDDRGTGRLA